MFYIKLSNFLIGLAIGTASGTAFLELAPSSLGIPEDEMTQAPVMVSGTLMCAMFWFCLTMDKIKLFIKKKVENKSHIVTNG